MSRSSRSRFSPTPKKGEYPNRASGCVRLVYNMALEIYIRSHRNGRSMTTAESSSPLTDRFRECDRGVTRDRAVNAARNVVAVRPAKRENACGTAVRSHRKASPERRS
ncbi:helix-turn-helix domain-containing protein [Actinomadura spongiicola]|uniref:helix-turn-helix domain-containing protein n=1 Tax=Actinomadura spongiicola TaxID=2303421 RepID=UPI0038993CDB